MPMYTSRAQKILPAIGKSEIMKSNESSPTHNELMRTIFFSNRERIMIGEDNNQYMTYLSKKLPPPAYSEDESDQKNESKLSIEENANQSSYKRQQYPSQVFVGSKRSLEVSELNSSNIVVQDPAHQHSNSLKSNKRRQENLKEKQAVRNNSKVLKESGSQKSLVEPSSNA